MSNNGLFKNMEEELQKQEKQPTRGLLSDGDIPEPSVEDLENEMDALGYKRGHDSDSIASMAYHTGMGVIGRTLGDIGHFAAYGGKPAGVTEKEWDETVKETGGPAALAHRINTAIGEFGEEMGNEHQRNYTPYSPKWFMNSLGYLVPSAVQLALVKKTGMFSPNAGEKMMLEGAGNVVANAATKVPGLARYAPQIGSAAATLAENATIGAKESIPEAFMESEDAKRSFIEAAKYNGTYVPEETEREAEEVARKVLMDNIGFVTATDTLQNVIMDKVAGSKGSAMRKMGKAALAGAPVGFTQEAGQGIIQKEAAAEPWEFTDPDIGGAGLVGAIAGSFPTGARMAMDYAGNKYMERKQAQNIKNMGQGIDETEAAEMEATLDGADNIRGMAGDVNDNNNQPPPGAAGAVIDETAQQLEPEPAEPGTIAAVEEMYRRDGIPSFEYTRDTRWVLNNDSVNVENLQDVTKAGIGDISTAFMELTGNPLIITSGTDGAGALHMDGTYSHGTGYKIDVSGNGLENDEVRHAFIEYCESRGITVLDEYEHPSPNSTGGHLDLEFHGYVGNAAEAPGMMAAGMAAEPAQDVFNEFAVPEDAYADTNITEGPFTETREQEPLFPEETARQQAAEPAAETPENAYEGMIDTAFEDALQTDLKTFNRSQLIDFAKGIQNLKLRLQAGEIDLPTAIKERNSLFNDIKNNRVQTAQAPQRNAAIADDTSRAGMVQQPQAAQQNVQRAMETRQQAPENQVTAPAVNSASAASQNAAAEERARIQRAAEQFNNDPELLRQNARQAMQWMRERVEQGEMTPDQLQANIAELEHSYRKIRERMAANRARQNRTPQSRLKSPAVKQIARRAGIKLQDVSRMAEITRNALAGKRDALKRFNVWRPEIRQSMQSIVTGTMPVNEALRSRAQTPALQAPAENVPTGNIQNTQAERRIDNEQKSTQLQRENAPEGNYQNADTQLEQNQGREDTHGQTAEVKGQNLKEGSETRAAKEAASESKEAVPDKLNRLIEKEFSDGEERELANSIFIINPEDPKGEWTSWRKSYRDELNNMLAPVMKVLRSGMKQGVDIVRMEGQRDAKYNRVSNNADWYRDFYKEHKRAPKDSVEMAEKNGYITTELEDIAIDVLTGKRKDVMPEYAGTSPETRAETAKNQREIDDILYNIGLLDNIKDGVFRIADAMNEKAAGKEVKASAPVKKETTNEPAAKKKIEDFGQKIGGARKDMYVKGEKTARPKTEKKPDDGLKERPWLRAYEFKQGEDGQWKVIHKASAEARQRAEKMDSWIMGFNLRNKRRGVESLSFDSLEAAQKAATIDALNEKHRLSMRGSGENASYYIARRIGGQGGHWFTIKTGFKTEQEAKEYMTNHAEEIMKIKTSFGEGDIVKPEIKGWNDARKGKAPQRLKENQNATAKMFADTFGFRGVQFGNWENQVERQSVMNAAYEGMLDLADMLGVEPKIVSLNGELGLAFGARGKGGKNSAAAHYEPGYTVINLTKMSGAGTLAHEWMHALDHYLMIKGGAIKNDRNSDGKLTDASFNRLASEEGSYSVKRLNLPEALKEAFIKLNNAIRYKEVVVQEDAKDAREWVNKASEAVDKKLNEIRAYLAKDRQYGSKKTAATEDQLKQFDEIAAEIAATDGEVTWNWQLQDYTSPAILKLSALHKEVTGRALITKNNKSSSGSALTYHVHWLQKRRATLAEALAKTDKVKQVPTTYYQNASDIDQGRSSVYWATRPEMLARAFSSMIEDTADAREYGSYFLSYGSDNRMYWFGKPFPEGAEREAINKAFGEFFTEVQKEIERNKKETGEIRFSVRATDPKYQSGYRQQHEAAMQAYGEDIKKVTDSITAEVKDAYPGAKDFKVDGDNVTFTMPNGVKLHVSIKDRIILNAEDEAKARQAHGLNDSNDIVVEGYSRKLDDGSVVVLSAEGSKGTTYHEALHTVRDWCLTEKENADLEKYYGKQAAAQGVSVDEAIADGYKEWKLARAKGSGTLFGKLYKKMSDFIDTVKAIFKGMTDVHEIYKKIESGEIWNRDAQGRFIARAGIQAQAGYSNPESRVEMPIVDAHPFVETEKFHKQVDDREAAWRKILEDKELEAVEWKLPNGHTNVISRSLKGGNWQLSWFDRNGEAFGDTQAETPVEFLDRDSTDFLAAGKQIVSVLRASDLNSDRYSVQQYTSATDKEYMQTVRAYQNAKTEAERAAAHEKLTTMVEKAAKEAGFENAIPEQAETYKIRTGAPPKKVLEKVYKVFVVDENGNPTALFVNGGKALPQGVWLDAVEAWHFTGENGREYAPTTVNPNAKNNRGGSGVKIPNEQVRQELIKRGFLPQGSTSKDINAVAYRPGWHGGDMPFFPQAGKKTFGTKNGTTNYDNIHLYNQVIFECEMANEKDYTEYHTVIDKKTGKEKIKYHDMRTLPKNGSYKFATNPMTNAQELGTWYISDSLKIIRALSEAECNEILKKNGFEPQEWQAYGKKDNTIGKMDLEKLGYTGQVSDAYRKTLAPITYDDDGNVIPLSQRFNREVNDVRYSIREKASEKIDELSTPVKKQYGNTETAFGRATQVISGKTEKSMFQKGMDAVKNFYFQMFDEDTHAHKVDKAIEKKTGKKLTANENFYNMVRENGSISKGHAKAMIDGTQDHLETIQSRIRNKHLKEQFNVTATLKNMMDIIDPKKMNEKYKDFLEKHNLRDWQQALDTYLAACRLKEMHALSVAEYNEKHQKWREKRERALKAGKEFTEKEPQLYRLPGKLTIQDVNAAIKGAPPELEKAAQVYYAFNKNLTILLADSGLLPPKLYHMLNEKYKRYCPLMRDFSDTAAAEDFIQGLARGNDSVVNVSNPLKEILETGSKRNLLSPLESTIKACAVYCDRAERNKVGQKAVKIAQDYKLDDLIWRVDGKHSADPKNCIFTVMINGEKVAYQCIQELYEPIVGAPEAVADMMFELAAAPARWLRTGATISPTFAIRNMIRDTIFAGIASKNGFIPVYDTVRGFMALRKNPKLRAKFEAMGVSMQTFYGSEYAAQTKMDELQANEPETLYEWVKEILKKPKEGLEWFSEMSEQSTRMGEFMRAIQKGKTLEEAARDARNLTIDFTRHGRTGKRINQIIPFFNACLQGGDLMVRLLYNDPAGTLLKLGIYIMLPSLACWAWNRDEDWYKDLDPDLKNSYWFVNTPAGIVRIPKPQEAGVLFGSGLEAMLELATERDPDAMKNWRQAFKSAIAPNYLVTVIGPLLENAFNYSTFRGKPIVGRANEKKPAAMQYTRGTSELSKMIGGSAPVKAVWDKEGYSPSKIDNLVRGYTGTMGILLWQWTGEALNAMRGIEDQSPAKKWNERPFVREFFVNSYGLSRPLNDFYDLAAEAEKAHTARGKIGKPSPAVVDVRKTKTLIANTRKEIYKIMDDKNLTPERKRELIDVRQEKINRIAKGALKKYKDKF